MEGLEMCPILTLEDLYRIVKESDRIVFFRSKLEIALIVECNHDL
ncbi:MAG: hypothetical protein ACUVWK_00535 [Nitrososphaerales archaeon]